MSLQNRALPFLRSGPLFLLLSALSCTAGWCVTTPAVTTASAAGPVRETEPLVFSITEVMPRSDRALAQLHDIRAKLNADTSVQSVEGQLPAFARRWNDWWNTEGRNLEGGSSLQRAGDLSWELDMREAQIDAWELLLVDRSKGWLAEEKRLDALTANWQATLSGLGPQAPQAVRDRSAQVLREADAVRTLLRQKTERLVAVQAGLGAQRTNLDEVRRQLEGLRMRSKQGLLSMDNPPLWTAVSRPGAIRSIEVEAGTGAQELQDQGLNFLRMLQSRILLHLIVFGALAALFFALRRSSRSGSRIRPTAAEQFILERSLTSALLLALCLVPLMDADTGPRLVRLAVFPALVPVLVLSPAIFGPRLRVGFYALTATYLIDFLRNYLPPQWLLARLLLFCASIFGVVGIALMLREYRRSPRRLHVGSGAIRPLLLVGMVLFAGSLVANVAGNVSMAEYLVSPLLRVLFLGAAIRLGVVVATTFVVMALRTRVALLSLIVRQRGEAVAAHSRRLLGIAGAGLWAYQALFSFGLLAEFSAAFAAMMAQEWHLGTAIISVRDFANFIVVLAVAYGLSRILRIALVEEIFPRIELPRGVPDALELLARYGVLLFGFLLALSSSGVNLTQLTLAVSALGVGIGFGLQHLVNNFVSGLILVFEHPIQVGDLVEVGSHYGQVQRIGFRASVVRTRDGVDVIIPNGDLIGTKVLNWTLTDRLHRVNLSVPAPIGADTDLVAEILQTAARKCPLVLAEPPPHAVLERFEQSSLQFVLHAWVRAEDAFAARDLLAVAVDKAFRQAAIQIPFPQAEVYMHFAEQPAGAAPGVPSASEAEDGRDASAAQREANAREARASLELPG